MPRINETAHEPHTTRLPAAVVRASVTVNIGAQARQIFSRPFDARSKL